MEKMVFPDGFRSNSLQSHRLGPAIGRILRAALRAADPAAAILRSARRKGSCLQVLDHSYSLAGSRRVYVLAAGKAAAAMSAAFVPLVEGCLVNGLIVTKALPAAALAGLPVVLGEHPVPDAGSLSAGERTLELLDRLEPDDLLVCLLSGGASALLVAPAPGLGLTELQFLTRSLLACGAGIEEINLLRRRLDLLKGGGLAQRAAPTQVVSLILSDVIGDRLEAIASGPTAPDPSSNADALALLERYNLLASVPPAIVTTLRHTSPKTIPRPLFPPVQNAVIANNKVACRAAMAQAIEEGFASEIVDLDLRGEARQAGRELAGHLRQMKPPSCRIFGGETTVTLAGDGRGGRNQELALAAALELDGLEDALLVSVATDGEDGPTDAAGALAGGETLARARLLGLDAADHLRRNDSYTFFAALGDLLHTGPTGTNVNDLTLLFKF